jgi:ADP-heptose:LPS heptosyltransferase
VTRVLVARMDSAGDVLLTGPAVRAVAHGAEHVTFLCGPRGKAAAELLPGVDEILCHVAEWIDPEPPPVDPARTRALVEELAAGRFDQAIVLTSFHQSPLPLALLLRLAGVPVIAAISVDYPGSLLDVRHAVPDDEHEARRALSLVATLGHTLPADDDGLLAVRRPHATAQLLGLPSSYVAVHPGASVPARAPSPERMRELVLALAAAGRTTVVTGAPDERGLTSAVAGEEAIDLGGATDLAGLADVLAGADAVVVGNTGPAHLAAAVRVPVVSLFAPTVPAARWRPYGVPQVLLHRDVPCAGCRARTCPVPGHPCLDDVGADEVLAALDVLAPLRAEAAA